jgi:type I restriction enzyme S subunit
MRYGAYKQSETAWLPNVPAHWGLPRLKTVLREKNMKGFPREPLLAATQSRGVILKSDYGSRTVEAQKSLETLKLVEVDDFVISLRSFQGGIERAFARGIISPAYTVLEVRRRSDLDYLALLFKSRDFIDALKLMVTGIREGQSIEYPRLARDPVPMPPAEEQSAIVKYLGHAHARIDRAIAAKRKLITLLEEQKQAIINKAVTRGLDPAVPLKASGVSWVGDIPEHWELRRAKDVCSDIVDCKNRTPEYVEGGRYTVVRTTCIRNGEFSQEGSYTTDRANFEKWTARGAPRLGDVFFTREAPMGEASLVPQRLDLCMGQRMMYLRPDPLLLDANFLLNTIYGRTVRSYIDVTGKGSTVSHLRLGQVANLPLLICPISEQREIVRHIDRASQPIRAVQARASAEMDLLREYRTRLTSDVVTGRLDVRVIADSLPELSEEVLVDSSDVALETLVEEAAEFLEEADV